MIIDIQFRVVLYSALNTWSQSLPNAMSISVLETSIKVNVSVEGLFIFGYAAPTLASTLKMLATLMNDIHILA